MTDDSGDPDPDAGDAPDVPDPDAGDASDSDPDSPDDGAVEELSLDRFHEALEAEERPVATASEVARRLGTSQATARDALAALVDRGDVDRLDVESDPVVFYPTDWGRLATRERVVAFPDRREIVVDRPTQFTRARLSQFAHLVDTTGTEPGTRGYLYRIRQEDVWAAPFDDADGLIASLRSVLPRRFDHLEEWVRDQWRRAHRFRLYTHEDGYVVLQAASESLMGNVADQHLDDDHLRAPISETEAWVNEDAVAAVKRALYDAGYPVEDDRDLDVGDPVDIDLTTDLREYQETWVETFLDARSGVYVGPPGSGKTVAAIATIAAVGGETLILVPSRELAGQWREELLEHSTIDPADIGLYHGGQKEIRPVTIATYQIAGMDRHRALFDSRKWGLICFDECLTGDTIVETPSGRTTFDELDERYELENGWTTDIDLSVRTFSRERGTYRFTPVTGIYKSTAPVERIETRQGYPITATAGHTHFVFDPESARISKQKGVSEGDFIVRPQTESKNYTETNASSTASAELLGWFLGDGHRDRHGHAKFSFARNKREQIGILEDLCDRLGLEYSVFENSRGDLTLWSKRFADKLPWDIPSGSKAGRVTVPSEAYGWYPDQVGALLRGLFDAEGSVDKKGRIQFNTVSERLAKDVVLLLQHLGIPSRYLKIDRDAPHSDLYRILIASRYGVLFSEKVGFRLQHKSERISVGKTPATGVPVGTYLKRIKDDVELSNEQIADMTDVSRQTIGDVIRGNNRLGQRHLSSLAEGLRKYAQTDPISTNLMREDNNVTYAEIGDKIDVSTGHAYTLVGQGDEQTEKVIGECDQMTRIKASKHADRLDQLVDLQIVEVTSVTEQGVETVYDFETQDHTFVANGYLTHNCHHITAPVFSRSAELQTKHRLGLSATPVRETGSEEEIYTLIGRPIGADWDELFEAGFVQEPEVEIRYVPWRDEMARNEYASADGRERRRLAAENPAKIEEIRYLLAAHRDKKALVFIEYLDQGEAIADALGVPFISGETPHYERAELFRRFRDDGESSDSDRDGVDALVVSRVGDEGIDLPNAELAVVASGLGGSRRQGSQRAGRTMRPAGSALVYVLATRGSSEEEFAQRQMRHLARKGIRVRETNVAE
ncbi:LAGLIDADG family homing endonuclease [Halorubrum halophilum]|uniref:LAGLIDADG family homing endonuclease n=1 Tax=Halorubrum halophilum TaxID=413816 RepID=UPI0009E3D096|nr:LAGLIDADG family homing endonuclease [Halorubrum halophilum]